MEHLPDPVLIRRLDQGEGRFKRAVVWEQSYGEILPGRIRRNARMVQRAGIIAFGIDQYRNRTPVLRKDVPEMRVPQHGNLHQDRPAIPVGLADAAVFRNDHPRVFNGRVRPSVRHAHAEQARLPRPNAARRGQQAKARRQKQQRPRSAAPPQFHAAHLPHYGYDGMWQYQNHRRMIKTMKRYEDPAFQARMRLRIDYNNMMALQLGDRGIADAELDALAPRLAAAAEALEANRSQMRWRDLPHNQNQIVEEIEKTAADIRLRCENFVVLGIGGSALGPIAVQQALSHLRYNDLPNEKRRGPRLFVMDNVDPESMAALLDVIDVQKTVFNVITKSGGTSETMSQLLIVSDILHRIYGEDISGHLIAITDEVRGNLIKIARLEQLTTFYVPDGVGGRFSELCPVGLLTAAVCGIDIRELLAGAAYMDEWCRERDVRKNPAYLLATLAYIAMQRGCNINVLMPYADSLKYISDWFAQLWAESLGKRVHRDGSPAHTGQTPVKALGVTDQHSQVQLYTEGPFDKVITFLGVDRYRTEAPIPKGYSHLPDVSFLCGHSLNELIQAEQRATEYAVMKSGHLSHTITLPEVNPFTIGELLYMFEVMTAFAGELLNINAFDQPGVEEGKNATYALLGKPGYDEKRAELAAQPERAPQYIIG